MNVCGGTLPRRDWLPLAPNKRRNDLSALAQCWQGWAEPCHPQHPFRLYLLAPRTSGRQLRIQKQRLGSLLDKQCSWPRRLSLAGKGPQRVHDLHDKGNNDHAKVHAAAHARQARPMRAYAVMHTCNHATMQPCGRATLLPCCHAQATIQAGSHAGRQPCGHAIILP
jgi:hypothetical protein